MQLGIHSAVGDGKSKSHARGKCDGEGWTGPFYKCNIVWATDRAVVFGFIQNFHRLTIAVHTYYILAF